MRKGKNELAKCHHCNRHNWHENTHCSWCARRLPVPHENTTGRIIMIVAVLTVLATAWRMI